MPLTALPLKENAGRFLCWRVWQTLVLTWAQISSPWDVLGYMPKLFDQCGPVSGLRGGLLMSGTIVQFLG